MFFNLSIQKKSRFKMASTIIVDYEATKFDIEIKAKKFT